MIQVFQQASASELCYWLHWLDMGHLSTLICIQRIFPGVNTNTLDLPTIIQAHKQARFKNDTDSNLKCYVIFKVMLVLHFLAQSIFLNFKTGKNALNTRPCFIFSRHTTHTRSALAQFRDPRISLSICEDT